MKDHLEHFRPEVVVAHSLGAAVAIDGLATSAAQPGLLLTAGSPLAWPRFRETWSAEAKEWFGRSSCVWVNLVDKTDEVTGGEPLPSEPYRSVRNIVVDNDHFTTYFGSRAGHLTSNHSISHYLAHQASRDTLLEFIGPKSA